MNARDRKAPAAIAERFAWLGQPAQLEDALAADLADALAADQDVLNRGGKMFTTTLNLGDAQVNVGYDYTPREPEQWDALAGAGHPGSPADVEICQVQINGVWIGPESFNERWIEWAKERLLDARARDPREGEDL